MSEELVEPTIVVRGSAQMRVVPTTAALVVVAASRDRKSSRTAQTTNAAKAQRVLAALTATGVAFTVLRTDVTLRRLEHEAEKSTAAWSEFEARHELTLETMQLDRVGALVDAAAGVESVQIASIEFSLDYAARRDKTLEVLAQAAESAKCKAKTLAAQFNAEVVGVRRIEEVSSSFQQARALYAAESSAIVGGAIEVSADVLVTIDIRHTVYE